MTAGTILEALLAATPDPPVEADVDVLLVRLGDIVERRRRVLDGAHGTRISSDGERALASELALRDRRWLDALAAARRAIAEQLRGMAQVRAYAAAADDR